jgi:Domain of unknown function (DUF1816)
MNLLKNVKAVVGGFIQAIATRWWLEVTTTEPRCTYYFGPFNSVAEAETAHSGYIEDLQSEGAQGIAATIKRCNPTHMTVCDDY